ncbi:MAG: hypothetical protein K2J72_08570 [Oscillospiraceae bacterium]|nr:hypothetical protein [Oscillospiraceae bacterium]
MRNSAKKLASAILALAMTAAMSVTAYAADYGMAPVPTTTASESTPATTEELTSAVESVKGDATAKVEVATTVGLTVKPTVLKELAKKDGGVLEIVAPKATISIDASTITKARNVNLSMKVTNTKSRTVINMASKKDFGCEVKITLTGCKLSAEKLENAHWYLNGKDMGPVELDEDGNPVVTLTKGGKIEIK